MIVLVEGAGELPQDRAVNQKASCAAEVGRMQTAYETEVGTPLIQTGTSSAPGNRTKGVEEQALRGPNNGAPLRPTRRRQER